MDSIVQLIRNGLCCIKDWNIFSNSIPQLYDSTVTTTLLKSLLSFLPVDIITKLLLEDEEQHPFHLTTPLELIISITQLYACLSCTYGGIILCWTSVGKLKRIVSLLEHRLLSSADTASKNVNTNSTTALATRLCNESLIKESKLAMKNIFIGLLITPIGISFFWLFCNSIHVTEAGTIGGLTALIDALTIMEICLIPLLYYMIMDANQYFKMKSETTNCITTLSSNSGASLNPSYVNITRYELIQSGWVPYWESGTSPIASSGGDLLFEKEMKLVEQTLSLYFPTSTSSSSSDNDKSNNNDDNEKEQKIRQEAIDSSINEMTKSVQELSFKGYREYVYFVLNFAAFYGYLMAIICFYYPDDTAQPTWMQHMKFNVTNNDADWTGNFVGDLMWTIEPIIIIFVSPYYIASLAAAAVTKTKTKTKKLSSSSSSTNKTKKE